MFTQSNIHDHIGNVRAVVRDEGTGNYSIINQMDYEPFGAVLSQTGDNDRQTFIGKARNWEVGVGNWFFQQQAPLSMPLSNWTPYQYSKKIFLI
jgi:hypothetical protein